MNLNIKYTIKLFRGFRQQLIHEKNLKKYLLYAIGEILLVMIGILLAFQVDNWNEDRVKKIPEVTDPEQIYSVEFQNLTHLLLQAMTEKDQTYKSGIAEIDEILALIDAELKDN
mgnify:CR=1 FL=1